jgi:hypothetical protein
MPESLASVGCGRDQELQDLALFGCQHGTVNLQAARTTRSLQDRG